MVTALSLPLCMHWQPSACCKTRPHETGGRWQAGGPSLHLHHSHGGCPILAFFARVGDSVWAILPAQLLSVLHHPLCMPSSYPPFAYAKDGAPASVVASAV